MSFSLQKQSSRNLVLSPHSQTAYGGPLADASMTIRQRFDTSGVFSFQPSNRTDQKMAGKGTEFATDDQITAWDSSGTIKDDADAFLLGWMLAFIFGTDTITGVGPYTHTFIIPPITATMPCTTIYTEETADVHRRFPDMAAKSLSLDVPKRGAVSASLDLVGTGFGVNTPYTLAALPALATAIYLLGSDVQVTITPAGGAAESFVGRQEAIAIKVDRGSAPYESSGDGLFARSVAAGVTTFSVDMTLAANSTDDVNGWFESGLRLNITVATNPANVTQFGFTWPSVRVKANKVSDTASTVTWSLSFDQETAITVGATPAISAFVINSTAAYLVPA